ncbi:flocculation protein FLO11 isoform X2 [Drosophila obscura]|uniref:flocculation protein FLO11 isoform X2 n=1 Tax=Drosophila obscura TaxID=7282 RepID=UPI001BB1913A|nr:flocculation protein FLO11 isoform X2 [Drosophila obscura]
MEDIEYLDEYKDLVLPGIKTGDGRSAAASASAASRRRRISSDSSNSSSIDADIFQKLFHGKFIDDELLNEGSSKPRERHRPLPPPSSSDDDSNDAFDALFNRKSSKPKPNKRRDRFESFDSVDDLGQALMRPTQRSTVPKPSTSRGAGRKSETEGLHRGSHSSSSGFGKSSKNLAGPHSSGKSGAQGHHSRNAPQGSSNGSSSNSVSRNSKAVTIIKTQKADLRPPKNEPKTDPLNLREFYGDSDSDSSYEYESDFYGDRDTDDEEPVIDISTDTSRTTSVAEAARRRQKQQQQLEKAGKDKQGQKKPVRRRNQLEAEERPPQKRTKIEDVGTATASTSTATASASANASASSKGKYISLIGKDTIISTTTDPHEEPSRSSGGARKSNVKNPKGPDTTKHIIISAVPKKSLDAAAESPPAPSKKPLVQSLLHSYVDARKATQKDSAPAGKKGDPEKNIPSSTVLTKKGVVPASDLPGKKPAETAKGEGTAAALRKVNISVSVMPSKEGDGGAADAAGKSVATSSAATAAQVTKALLDAEKNIISARRQVDTKKKPEAKKTVKISAPDKPKNSEQQARKEPRRPEMAEQSNKPDTSTAPARKSLPHAEPPRKPEPRKSEEAARMQAKSVKMPAVGHSTFKANEAREKEKYEQRRSDVAAIRGKAAIRTAEVETGAAPRDSSHERAGRTSRLGKGISLPTLRQTGISMSSHMTRAASSNRSLASTPIPMAPTPTPMAGVRRSAPKKPEPMVAPTPPDEALGPPKKIKRPARLPFGSRRRWSAKKRKATEDAEAESEATTQKRPRAEQEQDQEPEARPAPSIAFPVMITAASSSAHSPIPHSVAAGPAAVPATTKSQPTRTKTKLRKCLVKINRGVVKKWMAANVRKQPAAALQEQRSAPPVMPAPEPEPQTEAPAAESVQHQVPEPFPEPEPALDPAPAPAPLQPSLPTQPAPVAEAVQSVSVSVSVSASGSGSGQQAQKKTHGIPAMKLPIPIPVMEIKTEIEEVPPEAPMEEATLTAVAIPTPTVVAPDAPAEEELQAPEELVALAPSISSHQTTIRMSAPPAPVGRLVSSIPSASSAEASQKPGHTKIFSFLYPQRYQRSYGEVGLDFCCPNLDGPMRAIDPTRLHATAQVPVLELPQFMVITTKIISKADKDLPHKVRAKLAQLDKTGRPLMGQTVRMSTDSSDPSIPVAVPSSNLAQTPRPLPPLAAISNPPPPTASASASATPAPPPALPVFQTEVTVQSLTKQLPRGTTLTKKVLPPGAALPAAASSSMVASLPPALIQLPPICPTDKQRVELQTRVQMFDLVLQGLSRRAATLTLAERQRTIEEIVKTSTLMAIDVDVGTKLLENYVYYLNRATNTQTPMPSLRLNPVVTPAITQSTHTVASLLGDEPVAKRKFSTPSATATASATETASPSAPATKKPAQQRSSLPAGIPVYDADKNIIGYQCPTPNASIVNRTGPIASSTPLGPSTSAAAQSGVLGSTSKSARAGVQLNQSKKTKPPAGMAVKAVPKGSTGKRLGSGTIVSIHPPPNPMPSRPGATKPPVGVAQTLASLSTSPLPKAVPVPVPGSKSKSAAPTASGGSAGMNRARSPNVFIINQVSPTAEESILPDSHSVVPMQTEIKGELDDSVELIG